MQRFILLGFTLLAGVLIGVLIAYNVGTQKQLQYDKPTNALATARPQATIDAVSTRNSGENNANAIVQNKKDTIAASGKSGSLASDQQDNTESRFITLLQHQEFKLAVNLYADVQQRNETLSLKLNTALLDHIDDLIDRKLFALAGELCLAFLENQYNDSGLLSRLALVHYHSGDFYNAILVAYNNTIYAYTGADRTQAKQQFLKLMARIDARLADEQRWTELLQLYQYADELGFEHPGLIFRQAQLLVSNGDPGQAIELLESIAGSADYGQQAQSLLEQLQPPPASEADESEIAAELPKPASAIPLSRSGSHYLVKVRLNDEQDVRLMVDTGASISVLRLATFKRLQHKIDFNFTRHQAMLTAGGVVNSPVYHVSKMAIGDTSVNNIRIAILDYQASPGIDGLLGMNYLRRFHFQIDQDRDYLLLQAR